MSNDNSGRVSVDQNRIQQARSIQDQINASLSGADQAQVINVQPPSVSRYDYNGSGLSIQSGIYLREGMEEDGEPL